MPRGDQSAVGRRDRPSGCRHRDWVGRRRSAVSATTARHRVQIGGHGRKAARIAGSSGTYAPPAFRMPRNTEPPAQSTRSARAHADRYVGSDAASPQQMSRSGWPAGSVAVGEARGRIGPPPRRGCGVNRGPRDSAPVDRVSFAWIFRGRGVPLLRTPSPLLVAESGSSTGSFGRIGNDAAQAASDEVSRSAAQWFRS